MKIKFGYTLFAFTIISTFGLQNCASDKDVVKGEFESGVLIVNEGSFGSTNGDVTYYNASSLLLEQNIFKTVNGVFAGKVLESVFLDGDVGYLVANGGNKIEIINSNTFKRQGTFSDDQLINPRYIQVINGKAYISVWGAYNSDFALVDSYIMVVDIKTLTVIKTIDTDEGVEALLYNGKYLFASNFNFGASSTVAVIDPATDTLVKQIEVGAGPYGMTLDSNGKLWVITTSGESQLVRINTSTLAVEGAIDIGGYAFSDIGITPDKKTLIYSVDGGVYKADIDATVSPEASSIDLSDVVALYALGVDPKTGEIYVGDALDYSSSGDVYIYGADNVFKRKISAGIDPGQFIFK